MDLHIRFADEQFAIELKLMRKGSLDSGKRQLARYLDRLGLNHGYLIIFRRGGMDDMAEIGEREEHQYEGKNLSVLFI